MNIHQVKSKIRSLNNFPNVTEVDFEQIAKLDFDEIEYDQSDPPDKQFFIIVSKICKLKPNTNIGIFNVFKLLDILLSPNNLETLRSPEFNFDFNTLHCLILSRIDDIVIDKMISASIHLSSYDIREFDIIYKIIRNKLSHLIIRDLKSSRPRTLRKILRKVRRILRTNMGRSFSNEVNIILMHSCYFIIQQYRVNQELSRIEENILEQIYEINQSANLTLPTNFLSIPHMNLEDSSNANITIQNEEAIYQQNIPNFATVTIKRITDGDKVYAAKEYSNITSKRAREIISQEMSIMEKLSADADPENCFIKIYGIYPTEDKIQIRMDYISFDLKRVLQFWKDNDYKLTDEELMKIISKLINCFADLQERKIYHRDIKPQNILITEKLQPKVIDFNASYERHKNELSDITQQERVKGSINYMAPELLELRNKNFKEGKFRIVKADVFSLGLTLWELISRTEINGLNSKYNNSKLIEEIDSSDHNIVIKEILRNMLQLDYRQRFDFVQLLSLLNSEATEFSLI